MSRYVDLNEEVYLCDDGEYETYNVRPDAPSIDICFCRECKWLDSGENDSEAWSMCTRHFGKYFDATADDFCSYGVRNSSEKPNNCEHITEDGVTCAKYPACDDCLDNPLNKVKGSERLVKGSEKPNNSKERSSE